MNGNTGQCEDLAKDGALTVEEAARFLGLGRTALYALLQAGAIPSAKIGGRRVIPRLALVRHLAAAIAPPTK